jgi:hypothetical protein
MTRRLHLVFGDVASILAAVQALRAEGIAEMDAHTPWRIPELEQALPGEGPSVRGIMLIAGLSAASAILALQIWSAVWLYPLNVGGRPLFSWPAFGFATFETGILGAALGGLVAMIRRCGFPRLDDSFFETAQTEVASDDRLLLTLPASDAPDRLWLSRLEGLQEILETGR